MLKWLFGSKRPVSNDDSRWTIATATDNGLPLIIRVRRNLPKWCNKEKYNHLIAISWPFSGSGGMPNKEVNESQVKLEDQLDAEMEHTEVAVLTVIVTGNNTKEWQWYCQDPQSFMQIINTVLPKDKPLPIQLSGGIDPDWSGYNNFINNLK